VRRVRSVGGLLLAMSAGAAWVGQSARVSVTPVLEELIDSLRATGSLVIEGRTVHANPILLAAYERHDFEPIWSRRADLTALLRAVNAASSDGLDPDVYHRSALTGLSVLPLGPDLAAGLDLLATDAFVRLSHDLRFGRTRSADSTGLVEGMGPFGSSDPAADVLDVVASGLLEQHMSALRPKHFEYDRLVRGLAELRTIEHEGGWASIPAGPTMRRDTVDARVPMLRRRLVRTGDLGHEGQGPEEPASRRFDRALEHAVKHFQRRHGLNDDGRVGDRTLEALNVPVERRIEQVRVNLERARRAERDLPADFVSVDVAGARVHVSRSGTVAFDTRAVVGEEETPTPTFSAVMSYIELNPTWTAPRGMVEDVLVAVRADPRYMADREIGVLDSAGVSVDAAMLDFSTFTPETFPYFFHQAPGPTNPLGRIKLMFPNDYAVYLHDSPARWAFAEEERLFSHGCVRVEDPIGLAVEVLDDPDTWSRETLEDAISEGENLAIPLTRPLPVYLFYRTVKADRAGTLHFYEDVYDQDTAILAALGSR